MNTKLEQCLALFYVRSNYDEIISDTNKEHNIIDQLVRLKMMFIEVELVKCAVK